jgi:5-methylcytosine-specific restriction protein A
MPNAAPRVCARCGAVVPHGRRCACTPAWEGGLRRGTRGRRWTRLRNAKLRANPLCERAGCRRVAEHVDHVQPLAEHGAEYDWANLQSLCGPHATEKNTQDALRGKRRAR